MPLWRHVYRNFTALAGFWDLGGALLRTRRLAGSALSHITGGPVFLGSRLVLMSLGRRRSLESTLSAWPVPASK
jgi:hypothetical protein